MTTPQCSIWMAEKDFEKIIENIKNHDEGDPLYDGHNIEELYIDSHDGAMNGFISIGDVGVSIWIPFGEWFANFVKFKTFEDMIDFMEAHQEDVKETIDNAYGILNKINTLY